MIQTICRTILKFFCEIPKFMNQLISGWLLNHWIKNHANGISKKLDFKTEADAARNVLQNFRWLSFVKIESLVKWISLILVNMRFLWQLSKQICQRTGDTQDNKFRPRLEAFKSSTSLQIFKKLEISHIKMSLIPESGWHAGKIFMNL